MGGEVKVNDGTRTLGQMLDILRGWCWVEAGVANLLYTQGYTNEARVRVTGRPITFSGPGEWEVSAGKLGVALDVRLEVALAVLVARIPERLDEIREATAREAERAQGLARAAASRSVDELAGVLG